MDEWVALEIVQAGVKRPNDLNVVNGTVLVVSNYGRLRYNWTSISYNSA